tara:strand:- start:924 stop:1541 length:618 start_codon:yes stop_codon:yes gene_type:complete
MEITMEEIMKKYSTTFIECVKEWPENIQEDIYKLYSYLRVVDEMVEGGDLFNTKEWRKVIEKFHEVSDKYEFKGEWLHDFHNSMFTDLIQQEHTLTSMLEYCKGSSESVGLMMARILGCPPQAEPYARSLGRAYQIINFIRDYEEDVKKGYHYITDNHTLYANMFREELKKGMEGINYIDPKLRKPILMANEMYNKIAKEILGEE